MESIGVVGTNCRCATAETLARLSIPKDQRVERLPDLAQEIGASELLYLATCNRVEVAFRAKNGTPIDEYRRRIFRCLTGREPDNGQAERTFRAWGGEGAAEHLFLVASGLDSAQAGEHEIRAQVREALTMAREAGVSGVLLDFIVTQALRVALEVHRNIAIPGQRASLADIAVEYLVDRLHRTPGRVALIGISPMTRHCAQVLAENGQEILVVNRTPEAAERFARQIHSEHQSLAEFRARPTAVEALLVATGSNETLLGRPELERLTARTASGEPPLVVDMSVPSNTDRSAAESLGATLIDMDTILAAAGADRDERLVDLAPAREIIDKSLERLRKEMAERLMSPIIARLSQRYQETALEGLRRLLKKELGTVEAQEREALCRWAEVIARRFAHIPIMGLRQMAAEFGAPAVKAFLDASGEDFFPEDCQALEGLEAMMSTEE